MPDLDRLKKGEKMETKNRIWNNGQKTIREEITEKTKIGKELNKKSVLEAIREIEKSEFEYHIESGFFVCGEDYELEHVGYRNIERLKKESDKLIIC